MSKGIASSGTTPATDAAALPSRERLDTAVARASHHLRNLQRPDGEWCALLETDTTITSEFLLACRHLGRVDEERERKIVNYLSASQRADGGWPIHPAGASRHDATIKAYFAMKAAGVPAADERLVRARRLILENGGVETSAVFTKVHLAILGQMSWDAVPIIPPEMMLLPRSAPFNIYELSYWCRTIMVPLSIIQALRQPGHLPPGRGVSELFRSIDGQRKPAAERGGDWFSWKRFFLLADRALKGIEPVSPKELRRVSLEMAERWILARLEGSEGLGAIHPAMLNTVYALRMLGYGWEQPVLAKAWTDLLALGVETPDEYWMQPCLSPVWDTALAVIALAESGTPPADPQLVRAADWLLAHRTVRVGDWRVKAPHATPGAWAFQYGNDHYPDVDDTAMALLALRRVSCSDPARAAEGLATGLGWTRGLQSRNGGWGAFDRNNDRVILQHVPFADHGALLDEPTADVTGRTLELLGSLGYRRDDLGIRRGVEFLRRTQEPEGSWFGRWGVNYLYGTWSVLAGLGAIAMPSSDPMIRKAADWLEEMQRPDGGWGENPDSYVDRAHRGRGRTTASQTSWALLGLVSAGRATSPACARGAEYLLATQAGDGAWEEEEFTGTGFPGVLYLRYHQYRIAFPLLALARLARAS